MRIAMSCFGDQTVVTHTAHAAHTTIHFRGVSGGGGAAAAQQAGATANTGGASSAYGANNGPRITDAEARQSAK